MKKILLSAALVAVLAAGGFLGYLAYARLGGASNALRYIPARESKDERWGLVDMKGKFLVANEWKDQPSLPSDGIVRVPGKEGYEYYTVEAKPRQVGEAFDQASDFSEGLAAVVRKGGPISLLSTKGEVISVLKELNGEPVERLAAFHGGLAPYENGEGLWGFVNTKGEAVIPAKYRSVGYFHDKVAVVVEVDKDAEGAETEAYAVIDEKGERRFPAKSDVALGSLVTGGLVAFLSEREWGFLNMTGEKAIKPTAKFRSVTPFNGGYAAFSDGDGWGIIDTAGEVVLRPKYGSAIYVGGLVMVSDRGKTGFVNLDGEEIIRTQYEAGLPFFGSTTWVKDGRKFILIDKAGALVTKNDFYQVASLDRVRNHVLGWETPFDDGQTVRSDYVDVARAVDAAFKEITQQRINGISAATGVTDEAMKVLEVAPGDLPTNSAQVESALKQVAPGVDLKLGVEFSGNVQRALGRPRNAYYGDTYVEVTGYEPDSQVRAAAVVAAFSLSGKARGKGRLFADAVKEKLLAAGYEQTADTERRLAFAFKNTAEGEPAEPAIVSISDSRVVVGLRLRAAQ
jgi:hypothetical protein